MVKKKINSDRAKKKRQDEILKDAVDDFDKFEDFFSTNLKIILKSFTAFALLIIIAAVIYTQYKSTQTAVAAELTSAETIPDLEKAISAHSGNPAVHAARLRLASAYFNKGEYQKALDLYIKIAGSVSAGEIKNRAALNRAYTLEAMKKNDEAAAEFAKIGMDPTRPEYIRNEANFAAGRIYNIEGEKQKARNCLQAVNPAKDSLWSDMAEKLLHRIN